MINPQWNEVIIAHNKILIAFNYHSFNYGVTKIKDFVFNYSRVGIKMLLVFPQLLMYRLIFMIIFNTLDDDVDFYYQYFTLFKTFQS